MKVMFDTNILISGGLFEGSIAAQAIDYISLHYKIVICSYSINEFWDVVNDKFLKRKLLADKFLSNLQFELIYSPSIISYKDYPFVRDIKDLPILASAIQADVDILLTGDKDLLTVEIDRPEILSIKDFVEKYPLTTNH